MNTSIGSSGIFGGFRHTRFTGVASTTKRLTSSFFGTLKAEQKTSACPSSIVFAMYSKSTSSFDSLDLRMDLSVFPITTSLTASLSTITRKTFASCSFAHFKIASMSIEFSAIGANGQDTCGVNGEIRMSFPKTRKFIIEVESCTCEFPRGCVASFGRNMSGGGFDGGSIHSWSL